MDTKQGPRKRPRVDDRNAPSWHNSRFSDWNVILGSRTYQLHAFVLTRASGFFDGHTSLNEQGVVAKNESNLTELLPAACHDVFENALEFIYSEDQRTFEVPISCVVLLAKVADILSIPKLFELTKQTIQHNLESSAPQFLKQYYQFYIPDTNESQIMHELMESCKMSVAKQFHRHAKDKDTKIFLFQLPHFALTDILKSDDLWILDETNVIDFVIRHQARADAFGTGSGGPQLWHCVRWEYVWPQTLSDVLAAAPRFFSQEVLELAFSTRLKMSVPQAVIHPGALYRRRRAISSPEAPQASSLDIDLCFDYTHRDPHFRIISRPSQIGDFCAQLVVFPAGSRSMRDSGEHFLSAFVEAVPQLHWPANWKFDLSFKITCYPWISGRDPIITHVRWTFCETGADGRSGLNRGLHDMLSLSDIHKYLSPDGLLMFRATINLDSVSRAYLCYASHSSSGSD